MRYFPDNEKNKRSVELRERRDKYLNYLLDQVKLMIEAGTDKPCIASAIIKGDNEKLNDGINISWLILTASGSREYLSESSLRRIRNDPWHIDISHWKPFD